MALFGESLIREVTALVREHYDHVGAALGVRTHDEAGGKSTETSSLEADLSLLIDIANGKFMRSEERAEQADQALTRVRDVLLGNTLGSAVNFPDEFWRTDIGIVVSRVRWWASMDDLITISNAAALAFGENNQATRMRIARAIDNGTLQWFPDPSVSNTQQNRRVLLSEVERMRDLSRLPE